jgi:hypothetical protein
VLTPPGLETSARADGKQSIDSMNLPSCVANARHSNPRRGLDIRLLILDPTNVPLCEMYAEYRTTIASLVDGTGEPWTTGQRGRSRMPRLAAGAAADAIASAAGGRPGARRPSATAAAGSYAVRNSSWELAGNP